jgi:hypothetical protein
MFGFNKSWKVISMNEDDRNFCEEVNTGKSFGFKTMDVNV